MYYFPKKDFEQNMQLETPQMLTEENGSQKDLKKFQNWESFMTIFFLHRQLVISLRDF